MLLFTTTVLDVGGCGEIQLRMIRGCGDRAGRITLVLTTGAARWNLNRPRVMVIACAARIWWPF